MVPGAPCADAPVARADGRAGWLLDHLGGAFTLLHFDGGEPEKLHGLGNLWPGLRFVRVDGHGGATAASDTLVDAEGYARARYGGAPGVTYLIRPDQHVAARFPRFDPDVIDLALGRATLREVT